MPRQSTSRLTAASRLAFLMPPKSPDRVPVFCNRLGLARLDPAVVRLVVRVGPGHQLQVRPVGVGEDLVPHPPGRPVAEREELLAGHHVVVREVDEARLPAVVIAAEEVLLAVPGEDRQRAGVVLPPGDIHAAE